MGIASRTRGGPVRTLGAVTALVVVTALVLAGAFVLTTPPSGRPAGERLALARGAGPLDGLVFTASLGPVGKPFDVTDTLVFADGLFVSSECERRCDFPPRPYYVRRHEGRIEFVSETRCPSKNAKLVWRGSVEGGAIRGEMTWTASRWYRDIERTFRFEGSLTERVASIAERP